MRDRQGSGLLVRHLAANPQDKDPLVAAALHVFARLIYLLHSLTPVRRTSHNTKLVEQTHPPDDGASAVDTVKMKLLLVVMVKMMVWCDCYCCRR